MNNSKLSSSSHNLETSTITNKFLEFLSVIKITNRMAFFMHLSLLQIDFAMHLTTSIKGFVMIIGNYRREKIKWILVTLMFWMLVQTPIASSLIETILIENFTFQNGFNLLLLHKIFEFKSHHKMMFKSSPAL